MFVGIYVSSKNNSHGSYERYDKILNKKGYVDYDRDVIEVN